MPIYPYQMQQPTLSQYLPGGMTAKQQQTQQQQIPWYEQASSFGTPGTGLSPTGMAAQQAQQGALPANYDLALSQRLQQLVASNPQMWGGGTTAAPSSGGTSSGTAPTVSGTAAPNPLAQYGYGTPIFGRDATDWVSQPYTMLAGGEGGDTQTIPQWYSKTLNAVTPYDPATGMDASGQYQRYTPQWYDQQHGAGSYATAQQQYPGATEADFARMWMGGDAEASRQDEVATAGDFIESGGLAKLIIGGSALGALGGATGMLGGASGLEFGAGLGDAAWGVNAAADLGAVDAAAGLVPEFGTSAAYGAGIGNPAYAGLLDAGASTGGLMGAPSPLLSGGLNYSGQGLGTVAQNVGGAGSGAPDPGFEGYGGTPASQAGSGGSGFFDRLGNWIGNNPGAALTAGATLASGGLGYLASQNAAEAQQEAARNAQNLQYQMYQQNRADLEPWRNAGAGALNTLQGQMPEFTRRFGMSDFNADPGYQFRLAEGNKAIDRAARARGLFNSGGTMKALTQYGQNIGAEEYNRAYNRFTQDQTNAYNKLSNLAGMGQTTAQQIAGDASNYAARAGEFGLQGANAYAAGQVGGANTIANALNQGLSSYNQSQMLGSMFPNWRV